MDLTALQIEEWNKFGLSFPAWSDCLPFFVIPLQFRNKRILSLGYICKTEVDSSKYMMMSSDFFFSMEKVSGNLLRKQNLRSMSSTNVSQTMLE